MQIVIFVLHLQRQYVNEGWFSVLVATQTVFMWSKLHYFARVFNPTKNLFVDSVRIGEGHHATISCLQSVDCMI